MEADLTVTPEVDLPTARSRGFEALYLAEHQPMVRLAFLLVGDRALAEEIVNDAFAKVYERWRRVDNHGGYLRTCVVNRCRDARRRRRAVRRRHEQRQRQRLHAEGEPVDDLGATELLDALGGLNPRQRAVLVLRYYDGRTEAEIAALLDVPTGTVKSLASRALAQLREVIEP